MIIVMVINLICVRIVLIALGVEDYGLYNVIAGTIIMFQSVTHIISGSSQRYLSYSLGENKSNNIAKYFSVSLNIYVVIAILLIIICETLGLWFINSELVIPPSRIYAANWVYQLSIITIVITILQCPFSAIIISYEDLDLLAVITILESVLKLLAIWIISYLNIDRLIWYSASLMIIPVISLIYYILSCIKRYNHLSYQKITEITPYKEILGFASWQFLGSMAGVGMLQIGTILINMFFGLIANASRAISIQVNGLLSTFCNNFTLSIKAPIIKAIARQDYVLVNKLFDTSNKFVYYMMQIIAIPLYLCMKDILWIWLKVNSEQTLIFCRLIVIYAFILALNNPITIVIQGINKIKAYSIRVESITLLAPIITYILFKQNFPVEFCYYSMIGTCIIAHIARIYCIKKYYIAFNPKEYILSFLTKALLNSLITITFISLLSNYCNVITLSFISIFLTLLQAYLYGLNNSEKKWAIGYINNIVATHRKWK